VGPAKYYILMMVLNSLFYVTGADATECIKSTSYNMAKSGYAVHVISDGITSYNKAKIPEMIEYYTKKGCDVIKLNELGTI
jgi:isochorismatase hydrolase